MVKRITRNQEHRCSAESRLALKRKLANETSCFFLSFFLLFLDFMLFYHIIYSLRFFKNIFKMPQRWHIMESVTIELKS